MPPSVVVTGDVVLDCHLYGGVKTDATSFSEPGTVYRHELGGAALTHRLLKAAADAAGAEWDSISAEWDAASAAQQKEGGGPLPRPKNLPTERPLPTFDARFAFDPDVLQGKLPEHLHSYGVWADRPMRKGAEGRVWRIERHFGYGPSRTLDPGTFHLATTAGAAPAALTVIDDGAILFRHESFRALWPARSGTAGLYLLKMASPLCRGDLWPALKPVFHRLVVVVSANDLRREDIQISRRLSWEQTADDALAGLRRDPTGIDLLRAAHVVVSFGSEGALWVSGHGTHAELLFDPTRLEGEHSRDFEGSAYGFQTCLVAGIASHLMLQLSKQEVADPSAPPELDPEGTTAALHLGITAGLLARRALLEAGHGSVGQGDPGFPVKDLGKIAVGTKGGPVWVDVDDARLRAGNTWTILTHKELGASAPTPLVGLGELTARYGANKALSHVPALRRGRLFTVDRGEIESLRTLDGLIRAYEDGGVQKKPLCIGVFGRPGAGKSFGVKALAEGILGPKVPFLEFNLSQFAGPDDLVGAFHRVRDAVLEGTTPVAFWDEFDSKNYEWLQYLLAPMQDGAFQEGQVTHPIGKAIFVFAGGTSPTLEEFGVPEPRRTSVEDRAPVAPEQPTQPAEDLKAQAERYLKYKLAKGPDFVSRLHGFLNVLGPNPSGAGDLSYPIRRATVLRAILGLGEDEKLRIDGGLLHALLNVRDYSHGARSFEKIVRALAQTRDNGRFHRSGLPPNMSRDTDVADFQRLLDERNAFKCHPKIEDLAAAVHKGFLDGAERAALEAAIRNEPLVEWTIHPAVKRTYDALEEDMKASNRAAARRIPDHLALINFKVTPLEAKDDDSWRESLTAAIKKHRERLAQAEHLGWWEEREASGWTLGPRDNTLKRHPGLVPWADLSRSEQDKDYSAVKLFPSVLKDAKYKAEPVGKV
jgi:hypothetical protein